MFKKGDAVVCTANCPGQFSIGNTYILSKDQDSHIIYITSDDRGMYNGWVAKFFVLAEETSKLPEWF